MQDKRSDDCRGSCERGYSDHVRGGRLSETRGMAMDSQQFCGDCGNIGCKLKYLSLGRGTKTSNLTLT